MRTINKANLGEELTTLLNEKDPIDEDITILDQNGAVEAAIITKEAYQFFLRKVKEAEDEMDIKTVEEFQKSGEKNNEQ